MGKEGKEKSDEEQAAAPPPMATERLVGLELERSLLASVGEKRRGDISAAISDILEENSFALEGAHGGEGPYRLLLGLAESRLVLQVSDSEGRELITHILSLSPLRYALNDYLLICDNYGQAAHDQPAERLETIDMARRGMHDEGARRLSERLAGKIALDHHTARGLFTLLAILWRRSSALS
jgi:uncharacterized protein (UPF0262 family)